MGTLASNDFPPSGHSCSESAGTSAAPASRTAGLTLSRIPSQQGVRQGRARTVVQPSILVERSRSMNYATSSTSFHNLVRHCRVTGSQENGSAAEDSEKGRRELGLLEPVENSEYYHSGRFEVRHCALQ